MGIVHDACEKAGLAHLAQRLEDLQQTCICGTTDSHVPSVPGGSKLGGNPDVPVGFEWPTYEDMPLSFIGQINLADVNYPSLPDRGMLLFFYYLGAHGFDPKDQGSARVFFVPNSSELISLEPPWGKRKRLFGLWRSVTKPDSFKPCGLKLSQGVSIPSDQHECLAGLLSDEEVTDKYAEMRIDLIPTVQMFGYPDPVQNDNMELECQLVTNGLYLGDLSGYRDPRAEELKKRKGDWVLLLQVGESEHADMFWGDFGTIYFWIRKQDLHDRDFSRVWLILQYG